MYGDEINLGTTTLISAIGGAGGGLSTQPVAFDPFTYSNLAHGGLGYLIVTGNNVVIDPDATIDVDFTAVPVPPALIFLLSGLAGLRMLTRRQLHC